MLPHHAAANVASEELLEEAAVAAKVGRSDLHRISKHEVKDVLFGILQIYVVTIALQLCMTKHFSRNAIIKVP